ncbi:hypothetical protein P9112_003673 [Eukaryota sp. TZLM1-RC]
MEKKEPTDFIESLDESMYPQCENTVVVQTLNETTSGAQEIPIQPSVLKEAIELLDKESHELSTRPAERRMRLSPLDTEYKNIMGNNATLDNKGFRIRWLEVMEVGTDFSGKLDSPENVRLLPDWFRVGIDKIYEELSRPGEDYTVVREVHEYYPVSHRPNYVEMRPASQPFRLIYEELGVTYRRDDINMTTAVISTYRSPPNNRNLQTGDSWVQNKVFTFIPIIVLENTPFKSIRPFRPSIQLNFQDESKSVQELHVDTLPQPNTGPIGLDVLTIQPGDSSQPMEGVPQSSVDTTHTTGQGLSLQDLQATGSQQQHSQNPLDPRLILNQNLQSHVGYHYRTKAIEHATIHEPPRLEFPETQMKIVHFLMEFALWDTTGRDGAQNVDQIQIPQSSTPQQQEQITKMINSLAQLISVQSEDSTHIQQQIDDLQSKLNNMETPKLYRIDQSFIKKIGVPVHSYDLFRSVLSTVNPQGISGCIHSRIISFWKQQQLVSMEPTDAEILLLLCRRSQFTSLHDAKLALFKPKFNWQKVSTSADAEREYTIYMENFGDILRMCTYISDPSARIEELEFSRGVFTLPMSTVANAFLTGLDNLALTSNLFEIYGKQSFWNDKLVSFNDLTKVAREKLLSWMQAAPNKETIQLLRKEANKPKLETGEFHSSERKRRTDPEDQQFPQLKKGKHTRGGQKFCTFCQIPGHIITECRDPTCSRSLVPMNQRIGAGYGRGRGNFSRGSRGNFRGRSRGRGNLYRGTRGRGGRGNRGNTYRGYNALNNKFNNKNKSSHVTAPELNQICSTQSDNSAQTALLNPLSFLNNGNSNINNQINVINNTERDLCNRTGNTAPCINHNRSQQPQFLELQVRINSTVIKGMIDTAAYCSVISLDLANLCSMSINENDITQFIPASNVSTNSLGSAQGILTFNVGSIANQVSINHTLPIIPGSNRFLIGVDMLQQLGLLTSDRLVIVLDEERRTLLNAETEFDNRIKTHQIGHVESIPSSEEDFTQQ